MVFASDLRRVLVPALHPGRVVVPTTSAPTSPSGCASWSPLPAAS
jgi:hypothetical protein